MAAAPGAWTPLKVRRCSCRSQEATKLLTCSGDCSVTWHRAGATANLQEVPVATDRKVLEVLHSSETRCRNLVFLHVSSRILECRLLLGPVMHLQRSKKLRKPEVVMGFRPQVTEQIGNTGRDELTG